MKIELKTPEVRKYIGETVFVERKNLRYYGVQYLEGKVLDVQNKNVQFDTIDWLHFNEIKNIYTKQPTT